MSEESKKPADTTDRGPAVQSDATNIPTDKDVPEEVLKAVAMMLKFDAEKVLAHAYKLANEEGTIKLSAVRPRHEGAYAFMVLDAALRALSVAVAQDEGLRALTVESFTYRAAMMLTSVAYESVHKGDPERLMLRAHLLRMTNQMEFVARRSEELFPDAVAVVEGGAGVAVGRDPAAPPAPSQPVTGRAPPMRPSFVTRGRRYH